LNAFLNFVIKLVPLAGIVIAVVGLNTWRRQIKGTDKYNVASDLLLEVYRVREGIAVVRSPFIQFAPKQDENASKEMKEFLGWVEAMERRWKEVIEPVVQLSLLSLKAEVHLNKDVRKAIEELTKLVRELQVTYEQYVDVQRPESGFTADDFDKEARKILWAKPTGDKFKDNVLRAVENIESLTRKYL
jgi:hypothetical protein